MNRLKKENKVNDNVLDKVSGGAGGEDVKPADEEVGSAIAAFNSEVVDNGGNIKGTPGGNNVAK